MMRGMTAVRSVGFGESVEVPTPPAGLRVIREETCLRIVSGLPRHRLVAVIMLGLTTLAVASVVAAWSERPDHGIALVAWWVIVPVSATVALVCPTLAALALAMRRVVVLTPGVLVVREGIGRMRTEGSCLRTAVRTVDAQVEPDGSSLAVNVEAELSPTALRLFGADPEAVRVEDDETIVALLPVCRGERREVGEFLGRVIADWAEVVFDLDAAGQHPS